MEYDFNGGAEKFLSEHLPKYQWYCTTETCLLHSKSNAEADYSPAKSYYL